MQRKTFSSLCASQYVQSYNLPSSAQPLIGYLQTPYTIRIHYIHNNAKRRPLSRGSRNVPALLRTPYMLSKQYPLSNFLLFSAFSIQIPTPLLSPQTVPQLSRSQNLMIVFPEGSCYIRVPEVQTDPGYLSCLPNLVCSERMA